ncbi:hypothetical protein HGA91_02695 [candidate division WWE3 bacterium]|nr:hypothetical protein [candidate division WWE3 bacterium]
MSLYRLQTQDNEIVELTETQLRKVMYQTFLRSGLVIDSDRIDEVITDIVSRLSNQNIITTSLIDQMVNERVHTQENGFFLSIVEGEPSELVQPLVVITNSEGNTDALNELEIDAVLQDVIALLNPEKEIEFTTYRQLVAEKIEREMTRRQIDELLINAAISLIDQEPLYADVAKSLMLIVIYREVLGENVRSHRFIHRYRDHFVNAISTAIQLELVSSQMAEFDFFRLAKALNPERDWQYSFNEINIFYRQLLLCDSNGLFIETPQYLWMRKAMNESIEKNDINSFAIEQYHRLSTTEIASMSRK